MMKTFVVAKVFIVSGEGKLLTIRRSKTDERRPGQWDFPGGWVDDGEDMLAAAKREAAEEVGVKIQDPKLIYGETSITDHGSGTWLVFAAHVQGSPEVTLSYEHDEYRWADPQELLQEITYDRQKNMLEHAVVYKLLKKEQAA